METPNKIYLEKQKEQKPAEWKPEPESLEALMYAIEGKWEMIKPTSYLSRRLEDLYEGLVNTFNVDESLVVELTKTVYSAKDIEEIKVLKRKIDESMEQKTVAHEDDFVSKPAEWDKFDEVCLKRAIWYVENPAPSVVKDTNLALWLKDIPNRVSLQLKQEWSEEDEIKRDAIIVTLGKMRHGVPTMLDVKKLDDLIFWLKSLLPQPHWKPSEEQMKALEAAFRKEGNDEYRCTINSLYQDLKKLCEKEG